MHPYRDNPAPPRSILRPFGRAAVARFCGIVLLAFASACIHHAQVTPSTPVEPCPAPAPAPSPPPHRLGLSAGAAQFFTAAGTSGTYTVPSGAYVTSMSCLAGSGGATLVITPDGPSIISPVAGPSITIPASSAYSLSRPALVGNLNELGPGSTFVFTGTSAYAFTLYQAQ